MLRSKRSLAARQREMRKRQPPRRGRGRPPLPLHPDTVAVLAARGYPMLEIAVLLGCSPNTIYHRFREDFERGRAQLKFQAMEEAEIELAKSNLPPEPGLNNLLRYETILERRLDKAIAQLDCLQQQRRAVVAASRQATAE